MNEEKKAPIPLSARARLGVGLLGAILLLLPIVAYVDQRKSLLGDSSANLSGFNIVYAILAGIGGIFILSAVIGYWVMWKDVALLDPGKPDPRGITSRPVLPNAATTPDKIEEPPFGGKAYARVPLNEADPDFVEVAKDYFYGEMKMDGSFENAVSAVFRSTPGRPSWYFLIRGRDGKSSWVKIPHAGRGGAGAGIPTK